MPYRRYVDFSGRSRRMEYWMFTLFQFIVSAVLLVAILSGAARPDENGIVTDQADPLFYVGFILMMIFVLGSFIPALAVTVRRLHDQDKSGWWILIQVAPFGGLILLIFMLLEGSFGENRFGYDPKGRAESDVFA